VLHAEPRNDMGKGASRRLRRTNKVPAILYGAGAEPQPLTLDHDELIRSLEHEAFYSHILTVKIGGQEQKAILKDLQRHPYRALIQHMDLQRISESEKIRVHVPLHFLGEDVAPGVKTGGGLVSHHLMEVEVECYPRHLPEFIEVDVSALNLGEAIHLSGLKLPEGVVLVELSHGPEHDQTVVSIHKPRAAEAEAPAAGEATGGEAPPSA
jgi:large subunit ribosomal protein L25